jgi:5'-nucleotidase
MSMAPNKPRILVTNDDGYDAHGLTALVEALEGIGELIVVAPDREQSAAAHALTLDRPLRVCEVARNRYRVDGTPTDCVHLAVHRLTGGRLPDLVVSGKRVARTTARRPRSHPSCAPRFSTEVLIPAYC